MSAGENTRELLQRIHEGDTEAFDRIVSENMRLVHAVVRRFADRGVEYEDLFQIGCIGLIKAVQHFDMGYDVRFSTYAVPVIMGEIRRHLRDDGPVKVSRSIREQAYRIMRTQEAMRLEMGRSPRLEEVASRMQLSREDIAFALEALAAPVSLDTPVSREEDAPSMLQQLSDESAQEERTVDGILLRQLLDSLEGRERTIVTMRYFEDRTQAEVARTLGVSQVQVSRLESRILARLRRLAAGDSA